VEHADRHCSRPEHKSSIPRASSPSPARRSRQPPADSFDLGSRSIEDTTKARGAPIWFQLYASPSGTSPPPDQRAEARLPGAGRDRGPRGGPQPGNAVQAAPARTQELPGLPQPGIVARARRRPNYEASPVAHDSMESANMTWDSSSGWRHHAHEKKILVKGILAHEDRRCA